MVSVKDGRGPSPLPVRSGTMVFYRAAPARSEDGSEALSNIYEEIPYYGTLARHSYTI